MYIRAHNHVYKFFFVQIQDFNFGAILQRTLLGYTNVRKGLICKYRTVETNRILLKVMYMGVV